MKLQYDELRNSREGRARVPALLYETGRAFNNEVLAVETRRAFDAFKDFNPWHLCFTLALARGRYAKVRASFLEPATRLMSNWNPASLDEARAQADRFGAKPLVACLQSGFNLFRAARLPDAIPETLKEMRHAQDEWAQLVLRKRLHGIGEWNFAALFWIALFKHSLWKKLQDNTVTLPTGGAVRRALGILHADGIARAPAGTEHADGVWEPPDAVTNQTLITQLATDNTHPITNLHSGLYVLGTSE